MKSTKALLSILMVTVLAVAVFAGCGGAGTAESQVTPTAEAASEAPAAEAASGETGTDAPAGGLKIAIVSSPSGVDDGSFNQDNYLGIQNFIKSNPDATVTAIQEADIANSVQAVAAIVADYDVIVTPGFQFAPISSIAIENPEKKFILVDTYPSDPEDPMNTVELPNVYAMTFAEDESGFFAGMAAALETKTGKVAVVNGIAYPSNVRYQFGFESGVNYVNAQVDKDVQLVAIAANAGTDVTGTNVGGNYVGDFNDEAGGKVLGNALIKEGCDIIFVAAGASGNGVFTAAKEAGNVMVIGCDVDQYDDGVNGDKNIMLTSGLKVMHLGVERALQSIVDGSFKGGNVLLRADSDSTGYVKAAGRHQMSDETLAKLDEAYALLKSGELVPSAEF